MRQRNQPIIIQVSIAKKLAVSIVVAVTLCKRADAETTLATPTTPSNQEQDWHPLLILDTKYWIRNTEFNARDNWLNQLRPCTLLERVRLNEQSVISLGNSLDMYSGAIETTIRELTLAENGMLLLEDDIPLDPIDSLFIQYLNESQDCLDSTNLGQYNEIGENSPIFEFQPENDDMSWFNPANWISAMNVGEINDWIPESHQIPCTSDTLVFGSESNPFWSTIEPERSEILTFKVNFKASSELNKELSDANVSVGSIRVSRIKIGNHVYSQQEFEQLLRTEMYENILFEFNGGLLKPTHENNHQAHSPLFIDDSPIQQIAGIEYCKDEAGCLCGNENENVMKIICSFNQPIEDHEQPCYDPVTSVGYCNKICATVLTVSIDPDKFSERFIANIMTNTLASSEASEYYAYSIFASSRRVAYTKYEITVRHRPYPEYDYESTLGREREFAQLIIDELSKDATRSFYGIKTINVQASVDWRRSNRHLFFWISYTLLSIATLLKLIYFEDNDRVPHSGNTIQEQLSEVSSWLTNNLARIVPYRSSSFDKLESFIRYSEPNTVTETDENYLSEIPLIRLRPEEN